ncbi:MAG: Ig-like domain-containing protein, partial [Actinobacteria bacterium]|nr:Ig-like domain-containing protein [Actinomycetota bacterium]
MSKRMRVRIAMLTLAALVFSACGGGAGGGGGGASSGGGGDAPSGAVATGLQTATDGWSFPNFPSSAYADVNFDETDLVSMFGSDETICVGGVATPCKLTAEAAAWARMVNQARASGHCEGLVALASSRFNNKETPATVKLPSQQETLHAIMRTFATQFLPEVQESIGKWMAASFEDKIDEMKKSFAAGTLQYTLGVYTAGGGHALLPYAIEYPTPDTPRVMLYDSNWPGKNRYVDIDLKAKTWRFSFSGEDPANDPDAWTGGPQDMDLTPLDARQGTCPFCGKDVKVAKTTMLIRSANLDWSVETDGGVVSPANPTGTDGTTVKAVKGGSFDFLAPGIVTRSSYDYLVSVPDYPEDASTTTSAVKKKKKRKSKLKFSGATSVYAVMPEGIAQFTTPGSEDDPVEVEGSSISTTDPGVDLTLASGNLVANASGSAVSLSVEGETMAVAVTAANGQVIKQEVSADQPTVQMKADPEGGGITVLAASATGVVEKTEVSSTGETTKSVVTEALNLSEVKAELPPALASKENPALPSLATRDMANPDYKVDAAYSAPTTIPAKGGDQVAEAVQTTQAKASNAATPNEPTPTQPVRNAALPTTLPPKGAAPVDDDAPPTTVKRTVAAATSGTGSAAAVALKPSLGRFTVPAVTYGDAAFTIDEPSSNSSGGWRFTSSKPDVVEVSALTGRATIKGAGSTTITATQSAVKGFEQASITALLIVARDTPVLGAYTTASRTFGDESFVLKNPTSNSPGAFTVESSDESVAKFSKTSGRLVISGAGRTTITATQAATDDYLSAVKSFVLSVKKGTPELGAFDDVARTFGDAGFTLAKPTSDSRAAITLSSSNPAVATVDGASGAVSIVGAGTTTFTAAQAANDDFVAASKSMTFTVRQAIPALGSMTGATKTFGDASFSLTKPSSPSSGAFSFASSNTGVASVDADGKVTVVGAGTATITATQAASGNYSSSSVAAVVTVGRAATTIANLSLNNMTFGASDVTLAPRSNNPSPFTFSSSAPTVLAVNATTGRVTVVGAGTATIEVRQASSANYEAGAERLTVQIGRATPTLSSFSAISKDYGDAPFTLTPPESNSPAPFTYESSNPSVASIDASTGVVTIRNVTTVGSPVTLTARQAQTDNYAAITATTTLNIGRGTPVFGDFTIASKVWGSSNFAVTAPTSTSAG